MIGHEFVGEVVAAGDDVSRVAVGDRVLGTYCTACGECFFCRARASSTSATRAGSSATAPRSARSRAPRPSCCSCRTPTSTLRKVPEGLSDDVALFAGDVMGTGYHAIDSRPLAEGETAAVLGLGPVGLCAVQAAQGGRRLRRWSRSTPSRSGCGWPESFGADAGPPDRAGPARRGQEADRGARGGPARSTRSAIPRRSTSPAGSPARRAPSRPPASTPSGSSCTWASSGSRR